MEDGFYLHLPSPISTRGALSCDCLLRPSFSLVARTDRSVMAVVDASGERGLCVAFHWPSLGLHIGQASLGE